MGAAFDHLGDDGVGFYAGAGVDEGDVGEFVEGGFVGLGAAVEDEGGFEGSRGGREVAAEEADVEGAEGTTGGGGGVDEVVGVEEVVHGGIVVNWVN